MPGPSPLTHLANVVTRAITSSAPILNRASFTLSHRLQVMANRGMSYFILPPPPEKEKGRVHAILISPPSFGPNKPVALLDFSSKADAIHVVSKLKPSKEATEILAKMFQHNENIRNSIREENTSTDTKKSPQEREASAILKEAIIKEQAPVLIWPLKTKEDATSILNQLYMNSFISLEGLEEVLQTLDAPKEELKAIRLK